VDQMIVAVTNLSSTRRLPTCRLLWTSWTARSSRTRRLPASGMYLIRPLIHPSSLGLLTEALVDQMIVAVIDSDPMSSPLTTLPI
jgi:hypothetical protein